MQHLLVSFPHLLRLFKIPLSLNSAYIYATTVLQLNLAAPIDSNTEEAQAAIKICWVRVFFLVLGPAFRIVFSKLKVASYFACSKLHINSLLGID